MKNIFYYKKKAKHWCSGRCSVSCFWICSLP